jgi:hypothetical protein
MLLQTSRIGRANCPACTGLTKGRGPRGLRPIEDAWLLGLREPILTPRLAQDPNSKGGNAPGLAQHFQQEKDWARGRGGARMGRMNLASTAIFLGVIAALCVALRGLFSRRRSVIGGVIAASMALLATGLAWYAWAESQSTPWTLGYVVVAVASVASAFRQWTAGSSGR